MSSRSLIIFNTLLINQFHSSFFFSRMLHYDSDAERQKIFPLLTNLYLFRGIYNIQCMDVTGLKLKTVTQLSFLASLFNPSMEFWCGQVSTKNAVLQTESEKVMDRIIKKNYIQGSWRNFHSLSCSSWSFGCRLHMLFHLFYNEHEGRIHKYEKRITISVAAWKRWGSVYSINILPSKFCFIFDSTW